MISVRTSGRGRRVSCRIGRGGREFKIEKMSPDEKKIGLSLKAIGEEASRHEVEQYKSPSSSSGTGATLGEIINWKQGR